MGAIEQRADLSKVAACTAIYGSVPSNTLIAVYKADYSAAQAVSAVN